MRLLTTSAYRRLQLAAEDQVAAHEHACPGYTRVLAGQFSGIGASK